VVVVSEGSAQERSVVGEAPYLAAQLKVLAEPNTVVIATSTRRQLGGLFEYRDLGAVEVEGAAAPLPACQVLRPSAVVSRFEALHGSALTALVGRDEEIDLLLRRWTRAQTEDGQVVLISGEPGIGKSRIRAELEGRLNAEPHIRLRAISAHPITRTARCSRLSTSLSDDPGRHSRGLAAPRMGSRPAEKCLKHAR
jgi:hypothetical protein